MKILCFIDSLGSGGAQRQIVGLALGFKKNGHEVTFLTYHSQDFYEPILIENDIEVNCIQETNYLKRMFILRKFIRKANCDVLLSFLTSCNFIAEISGLPFRSWKLVVGERNANPKILTSTKLKLFRWLHFFSDYVVSNSHENIKMVQKVSPLISKKKLKVIYNLLDLKKWSPKEGFEFLSKNKIQILVAASHIHRKNLLGLVKALSFLNEDESSKIQIDWYGDGCAEPYFDSSFQKASELIKKYNLERIINFYPATDEISEKIKSADVVALFSFNEGLPNILCEGMACGKLVLSSNVSDIPKIINNKNLIFNPNDAQSIKNTFKYLISLNKEKFIKEGVINRTFAEANFDEGNIVNQYLKLFK